MARARSRASAGVALKRFVRGTPWRRDSSTDPMRTLLSTRQETAAARNRAPRVTRAAQSTGRSPRDRKSGNCRKDGAGRHTARSADQREGAGHLAELAGRLAQFPREGQGAGLVIACVNAFLALRTRISTTGGRRSDPEVRLLQPPYSQPLSAFDRPLARGQDYGTVTHDPVAQSPEIRPVTGLFAYGLVFTAGPIPTNRQTRLSNSRRPCYRAPRGPLSLPALKSRVSRGSLDEKSDFGEVGFCFLRKDNPIRPRGRAGRLSSLLSHRIPRQGHGRGRLGCRQCRVR